jgi:hypothetical protein
MSDRSTKSVCNVPSQDEQPNGSQGSPAPPHRTSPNQKDSSQQMHSQLRTPVPHSDLQELHQGELRHRLESTGPKQHRGHANEEPDFVSGTHFQSQGSGQISHILPPSHFILGTLKTPRATEYNPSNTTLSWFTPSFTPFFTPSNDPPLSSISCRNSGTNSNSYKHSFLHR